MSSKRFIVWASLATIAFLAVLPSPFLKGFRTEVHVGFVEIDPMKNNLLTPGPGGDTILAILYCFTPLSLIVLTALGLTGLPGVIHNKAVLLPILAGFFILTGCSPWRQKKPK